MSADAYDTQSNFVTFTLNQGKNGGNKSQISVATPQTYGGDLRSVKTQMVKNQGSSKSLTRSNWYSIKNQPQSNNPVHLDNSRSEDAYSGVAYSQFTKTSSFFHNKARLKQNFS